MCRRPLPSNKNFFFWVPTSRPQSRPSIRGARCRRIRPSSRRASIGGVGGRAQAFAPKPRSRTAAARSRPPRAQMSPCAESCVSATAESETRHVSLPIARIRMPPRYSGHRCFRRLSWPSQRRPRRRRRLQTVNELSRTNRMRNRAQRRPASEAVLRGASGFFLLAVATPRAVRQRSSPVGVASLGDRGICRRRPAHPAKQAYGALVPARFAEAERGRRRALLVLLISHTHSSPPPNAESEVRARVRGLGRQSVASTVSRWDRGYDDGQRSSPTGAGGDGNGGDDDGGGGDDGAGGGNEGGGGGDDDDDDGAGGRNEGGGDDDGGGGGSDCSDGGGGGGGGGDNDDGDGGRNDDGDGDGGGGGGSDGDGGGNGDDGVGSGDDGGDEPIDRRPADPPTADRGRDAHEKFATAWPAKRPYGRRQ